MIKCLSILFLFVTLYSCKNETKTPVLGTHEIQNVIQHMTDIMIHDITNPPLAARFFHIRVSRVMKLWRKMIPPFGQCVAL